MMLVNLGLQKRRLTVYVIFVFNMTVSVIREEQRTPLVSIFIAEYLEVHNVQ